MKIAELVNHPLDLLQSSLPIQEQKIYPILSAKEKDKIYSRLVTIEQSNINPLVLRLINAICQEK